MHKTRENNYAYIDGANLHRGVASMGWKLDYKRFRVLLKEKYGVTRAYIFLGFIPQYMNRYKELWQAGYILVFKDVIYDRTGKPKGNCDADLVLRAMVDYSDGYYDRAVLVSSDGDYAGMVRFLKGRGKMRIIVSPHQQDECSVLLKRTHASITGLNDLRNSIEFK